MTPVTLSILALAALLVCWAVGAHNRLVRLRGAVADEYLALQAHLMLRQSLLRRGLDASAAWPHCEGSGALAQAVQSLQEALEALSRRDLGVAELDRLQQAEQALAQQMQRFWAQAAALPAGSTPPDLARWASDLLEWQDRMVFLLGPFWAAVRAHNEAVLEFPAVLMARVSGLQALPQLSGLGDGLAPEALHAFGLSSAGDSGS